MESRKLLIIIRYFALSFLILGVIIFKNDNVNLITVLLLLLFIINNQIRFFIINNNRLIVLCSLILEYVLAYIGFKNYGGIVFFYFFTAALDSVFLLKNKLSYLSGGLMVTTMILLNKSLSVSEMLSSIFSIVTICILSTYVKDEKSRKIYAQNLYDKLRMSEEKLKKANKDLENYANSIEELTLLRERNRISREIHDSVGHSLSTMIIQLGAIEKVSLENGEAASLMAKNLGEFAKTSLQEVRTAVRDLKPREFEKYEGILAIEELIKNFNKLTGIEVKLGFTEDKWEINSDQCFVIYRVVQEFLSNSLRHGKATKVNIFMNFSFESLIITLQDNGIGTDQVKKGMGLTGIWERVRELGGNVTYNSKKGQGFFLKVVLYKGEVLNIPH